MLLDCELLFVKPVWKDCKHRGQIGQELFEMFKIDNDST